MAETIQLTMSDQFIEKKYGRGALQLSLFIKDGFATFAGRENNEELIAQYFANRLSYRDRDPSVGFDFVPIPSFTYTTSNGVTLPLLIPTIKDESEELVNDKRIRFPKHNQIYCIQFSELLRLIVESGNEAHERDPRAKAAKEKRLEFWLGKYSRKYAELVDKEDMLFHILDANFDTSRALRAMRK